MKLAKITYTFPTDEIARAVHAMNRVRFSPENERCHGLLFNLTTARSVEVTGSAAGLDDFEYAFRKDSQELGLKYRAEFEPAE